jgi:hypothetical protein
MHFLNDISFADLQKLRTVVRKVHMTHYRDDHVNDYEADKIIATLGPETREKMIRFMVDKGEKIG